MKRHELDLGNIVRGPKISSDRLSPTVDNDPVFLRCVYHLVNAKLMLHFNLETGFFFQLSRRCVSYTLESVDLSTRENPIAPLRIFITLS